jgi:glutamine synthetase
MNIQLNLRMTMSGSHKNFGFEGLGDVMNMLNSSPEVRFIRFITADMNGDRPCGFSIPLTELGGEIQEDGSVRFREGEGEKIILKGFDASSLYPERINESDKNAVLDFTTARVIP